MGAEPSKISKPKLTIESDYSTSNRTPRSPRSPCSALTLTNDNSTSISMHEHIVYKPSNEVNPSTPLPLLSNYSSSNLTSTPLSALSPLASGNSYGAATTPLSALSPLSLDDSNDSYSQRLALVSDTLDINNLPKKMDDNKIINKNQGKKPKQYKKAIKKHRKNDDTNISRNKHKINNGITNKYISEKIAKCASVFWINNIDILSRKEQLEIGCIQYFYLLQEHPQLNKFFPKEKIEETALRFFDMFGWLIRSLTLDGINLWKVLAKIGEQHIKMGIKIHYYEYLLDAFHYAMSQTFTQKYTIQIKYCMDQIYIIATCIMNGRQYEQLNTFGNEFGDRILDLNNCKFLESLSVCLDYEIGREYLFRFLAQKYCSEIVIFLQLYQQYKEIFSQHHIEKLDKAKEIAKISLSTNSEFPINVSYSAMSEFWSRLRICEMNYESNMEDFQIDPLLFETVLTEIIQLILSNHWIHFTHTIKKMQQQNSVENN